MLIQNLILKSLVENETYTRKCIPFIDSSFFEEKENQIVFEQIDEFFKQYNSLPTKEALLIGLAEQKDKLDEKISDKIVYTINEVFEPRSPEERNQDFDWLLDSTEKWCQERAVYNSIVESINILDGRDRVRTKHAIPKILQDALSLSFDSHVGHDYLENFQERFEFYRAKEDKLPFDIDMLNKITNGGVSKKSLNLVMGVSGSGKSLILCHFSAAYLMQSQNVLYITAEMAEERIAERIDANLMNVPINALESLAEPIFKDRLQSIAEKTKGRLIIKEYPTGIAHSGHFRALINELKVKKNFVPDVILIDYLNICASARIKGIGGSVNTYSYIKAVAEEIRGLSIEFNVPIWTATQSNRSSVNNSEMDTTNTSESYGTVQTVDLMLGAIVTEELQQRGQIMFKQLKNRYNDPSYFNKFYVGVDRPKMKLFNLEESAAAPEGDGLSQTSENNQQSSFNQPFENTDSDYDFSQFKI